MKNLNKSSVRLGIQYEEPIKTSWKPPKCVLAQPESRSERIRQDLRILVEGEDVPPPLKTFAQMKFPKGYFFLYLILYVLFC